MSELYQLPSDIRNEFIVTVDGRVFAKSWTAIARLAGVTQQTITERVLPRINTVQPESLPITLKPLSGMGLKPTTSEIPEVVISCIINYYAWESKVANNTAKRTALAFNAVGIRELFRREYGWEQPNDHKQLESNERMLIK